MNAEVFQKYISTLTSNQPLFKKKQETEVPALEVVEAGDVETVITDGIVDNDEAASAVTFIQVGPIPAA